MASVVSGIPLSGRSGKSSVKVPLKIPAKGAHRRHKVRKDGAGRDCAGRSGTASRRAYVCYEPLELRLNEQDHILGGWRGRRKLGLL